jgi:uncharacterized membrane protein YbhN (UPF0104 family)
VGAVVVVALLRVSLFFCHGAQVKVLTDHYNLNLRFSQWFGLSRMTTLANLVLPLGSGSSLKAVYLQRFHNLTYSSFLASAAVGGITRIVIMSFLTMALLLPSWPQSVPLLAVMGAAFAGGLLFILFGHKLPEQYYFSSNKLLSIVKEWRKIRTDHKTLGRLAILNCIIYVVSTLEIYVSFKAFSIDASLVSSGVISAFTTFSGAIGLIPANLGIKEAIFMTISAVYGMGINEGLHAAALHRVVGAACTILLAPGFAYPLSAKINE